jgi:murein DD-endopeptidase MepM/ murein hydrolase activator NlpD
MKKLRYYYNPKTLNYEKVETSWKNTFFRVFGLFSVSIIFAFFIVIIYNLYFESPKERIQRHELEKMKIEYRLMSKELNNMNEVLANLQQRDDKIYRVIFEADPLSKGQREAGFGGVNYLKRYEGFDNTDLMKDVAEKIEKLKSKLVVQSISYDEISKMVRNKEALLSATPAIQPISNKDLTRFASGFGYRIHPVYKTRKFHKGIDFTAPRGTPVYATADGTIERADRKSRGYGNQIIINHGFGYKTRYAHLNKYIVRPGQKIKRGELIGYVGTTGLSTAPHLHYEVFKNGTQINPINFFFNDLTPEEYNKLIEISNTANQSFD